MLLLTGIAQLVTATAIEAVIAARRHQTLDHELAVDSALLVLADRLTSIDGQPSDLVQELDRAGKATFSLQIGELQIRCTIRDDAAKFNPLLWQRPDQQVLLTRKLTTLASKQGLPPATVHLQPVVSDQSTVGQPMYRWYDQVLSDSAPGMLFRLGGQNDDPELQPVWSDAITFWGDGRIDLRRVSADVLEAALEDIRPGLAKILLSARPADPSLDFLQTALIGIHAEIREQVADRLTYDANRYAITMDTSIYADHRRWYVVAQIAEGDVNVLRRSQLTW